MRVFVEVRSECIKDRLWTSHRTKRSAIHKKQRSFGLRNHCVINNNAVCEFYASWRSFSDCGFDGDFVIVANGTQIANVHFRNREENIFQLKISVHDSQFSQGLNAADFEPCHVRAVVCEAHLISFGVSNAERNACSVHCKDWIPIKLTKGEGNRYLALSFVVIWRRQ